MEEPTRGQKQEIIDNHTGVLTVAPFEVEVSDFNANGWNIAYLFAINREDDYPYKVYDNSGRILHYINCRLTQEQKTRPMTASEIKDLVRKGADFIHNLGYSTWNPEIRPEFEGEDILIGDEYLKDFKGYRLPGEEEVRPFTTPTS